MANTNNLDNENELNVYFGIDELNNKSDNGEEECIPRARLLQSSSLKSKKAYLKDIPASEINKKYNKETMDIRYNQDEYEDKR